MNELWRSSPFHSIAQSYWWCRRTQHTDRCSPRKSSSTERFVSVERSRRETDATRCGIEKCVLISKEKRKSISAHVAITSWHKKPFCPWKVCSPWLSLSSDSWRFDRTFSDTYGTARGKILASLPAPRQPHSLSIDEKCSSKAARLRGGISEPKANLCISGSCCSLAVAKAVSAETVGASTRCSIVELLLWPIRPASCTWRIDIPRGPAGRVVKLLVRYGAGDDDTLE